MYLLIVDFFLPHNVLIELVQQNCPILEFFVFNVLLNNNCEGTYSVVNCDFVFLVLEALAGVSTAFDNRDTILCNFQFAN